MKPTVVVMAHDRPDALGRLLCSLAAARHTSGTDLLISIDPGSPRQAAVERTARGFIWGAGQKTVRLHDSRLGLVDHFLTCGDLTAELGPIVLLEDDLVVADGYFEWAAAALDYYSADSQVGGLSLNALWFNGFNHLPFVPILDGTDVFFAQIAWFQGVAMLPEWWQSWRDWLQIPTHSRVLHPAWDGFADDEWFPLMTRFLAETGARFAFPRASLTSNFGDVGAHFSRATSWFQVPLVHGRPGTRFAPVEESLAVYDSYLELEPERLLRVAAHLPDQDFCLDLAGERPREAVTTDAIITSRPVASRVRGWSTAMQPALENIVWDIAGTDLSLAAVEDVRFDALGAMRAQHVNRRAAARWRRGAARRAGAAAAGWAALTWTNRRRERVER